MTPEKAFFITDHRGRSVIGVSYFDAMNPSPKGTLLSSSSGVQLPIGEYIAKRKHIFYLTKKNDALTSGAFTIL